MSSKPVGHNRPHGFATEAIHHGYDPADYEGALTPPVFMTSTYAFPSAEHGSNLFSGEVEGYVYGRTRNPTQHVLEQRMAVLESGEAALAVASGIGAIATTCWALLKQGDEVIIDHTLYGSTFAFFTRELSKFGVRVITLDLCDASRLARHLNPATRLIYFETPANPNLRVIDVRAIAALAADFDVRVAVDNTFATPALQRPLELGADLVIHSATKYLGGHGDLLAGLVVGDAATVASIRKIGLRCATGATISPMNAFLLLRGLKTLELRMQRHCDNARAVAGLLANHRAVTWTAYPGLENHPQRTLAASQMADAGGLVAFELQGGKAAGMAMMDRLELVTRAVSLGDAETLIQHPASMTHSIYSEEERRRHGITEGLLRLSVGLETVDDILADLQRALDQV